MATGKFSVDLQAVTALMPQIATADKMTTVVSTGMTATFLKNPLGATTRPTPKKPVKITMEAAARKTMDSVKLPKLKYSSHQGLVVCYQLREVAELAYGATRFTLARDIAELIMDHVAKEYDD